MEQYGEEPRQVSKYNEAQFSISRLHESWLICKKAIREGNFKTWKTELDNIYLELITDIMRQPNSKVILKVNNKLKAKIAKSKNKIELFNNLISRHAFLRRVQDKAGKAGIYKDEDEEGFE